MSETNSPVAKNVQASKTKIGKALPKTSNYDFVPGQAVMVRNNNCYESGYQYVKKSEFFHYVVRNSTQKEVRVWLNMVMPPEVGAALNYQEARAKEEARLHKEAQKALKKANPEKKKSA